MTLLRGQQLTRQIGYPRPRLVVVAPEILAALLALSFLGGVGFGWWLTHRIDAGRLKAALGAVLFGLALSLVV